MQTCPKLQASGASFVLLKDFMNLQITTIHSMHLNLICLDVPNVHQSVGPFDHEKLNLYSQLKSNCSRLKQEARIFFYPEQYQSFKQTKNIRFVKNSNLSV